MIKGHYLAPGFSLPSLDPSILVLPDKAKVMGKGEGGYKRCKTSLCYSLPKADLTSWYSPTNRNQIITPIIWGRVSARAFEGLAFGAGEQLDSTGLQ